MVSKKSSTKYPGVRYKTHKTRKYSGNKLDRYFSIRYRANGKPREEGLGWASEGWNPTKASGILADLKKAHLTGDGPQTLEEKRQLENERREAEILKKKRREKDQLTFNQYFNETYFPTAQANKKEWSWKREKSLFKLWISPIIGEKPLKDIIPLHLERIKKNMIDADKAPRSVNYSIAVVRQVFNSAKQNGFFHGNSPLIGVRQLKFDNKRFRFLTHSESDKLMSVLESKNQQLYEMAMLSLHCGLRADEVFSLIWGDINIDEETILVRDTKNSKNRTAIMTKDIKNILDNREKGTKGALLFPNESGQKYKEISKLFREVIAELGYNEGVTDRRGRMVFHTLRHTYASWMVQNGENLYTVKELLGHSTMAMTERYSHLAKDNLKNAVKTFEDSLDRAKNKKNPVVIPLQKG